MPVRTAWLVGAGLAVLLSGVIAYLGCRSQLPWLLAAWPWPALPRHCPQALLGWWPSAAHAFGFTCLLGAALGGGARALFASGLLWALTSVSWEAFCLVQAGAGDGGAPTDPLLRCTADGADALAAVIAAALPGLLVRFASGFGHARTPQPTPGES